MCYWINPAGSAFSCPLCFCGIFTEPVRNQCTFQGPLLHANYNLLLIEFTITANTAWSSDDRERRAGKSLLPKFISISQLKLATTKRSMQLMCINWAKVIFAESNYSANNHLNKVTLLLNWKVDFQSALTSKC